MNTTEKKEVKEVSFSIDELDITKKCDESIDMDYIDANGKKTGIVLLVLGSQSPRVQGWVRRELNRRRKQNAFIQKRGKDVEPETVEDDEEFSNEAAAVRIVGWRGIKQEYTPELAIHLMTINSLMRDQVFKASNEIGNFTKG